MKFLTFSFASCSLIALAVAADVQAADADSNRSIEDRLAKLEAQSKTKSPVTDNISFSGLVEVEGSAGEFDNESYSDLVVATVELGMSAKINDKVSADVVLLYEEDDTELDVDVATINIDKLVGPVNLTLGKMYVPFGRYETALVNDTLPLELGETNKTAALFGFEQGAFSAGAYIFDGDADREEHAENYGLTISFTQDNLGFGLDYISALTESDSLADPDTLNEWDDSAPAFSLSGSIALGDIKLLGEYLTATSELVPAGAADGIEPSAFQLEADLGLELNGQSFTFAVAYQQTDDAATFLPEERLSLGCSTDLYENVSLGIEFWHDEDYSVDDGGTGEDGDNIVVQLAVAF